MVACNKPPFDACHIPNIDTSSWKSVGSDSLASVWDDHLKLRIPNNFEPKSRYSQHGGFSYGFGFSKFEIDNGFWGIKSFLPEENEDYNLSSCTVAINGQKVLITSSKGILKYYVSAWQIGGDPFIYGYTHAYFGESFSKKGQEQIFAVIRSIKFKEYSIPNN